MSTNNELKRRESIQEEKKRWKEEKRTREREGKEKKIERQGKLYTCSMTWDKIIWN